jgi:hypothetical protein
LKINEPGKKSVLISLRAPQQRQQQLVMAHQPAQADQQTGGETTNGVLDQRPVFRRMHCRSLKRWRPTMALIT